MKVEFYSIDELCTERVAFYSVLLGDNEQLPNEYREFEKRMNIKEANANDFKDLKKFIINRIGVDGAISKHFKNERNAERIKQRTPDEFDPELEDPKDYGLRLYCLRLSEQVVVLFNGDRKWYNNPEDCPNCSIYFERANKIAAAINEAIHKKDIYLDGFDICYTDESEENPFYITI